MQSGKLITLSVWLMIMFNILLSFGAVWSLQRINPEVKNIYERNVVSLDACENMLLLLADGEMDYPQFQLALQQAAGNITEAGEKESVAAIRRLLQTMEDGDMRVKPQLIREIIQLSKYNKQAIINAARQTQRLRQAGMWGIVFVTVIFFLAALFFEQKLRRVLLAPLQEVSSVMEDYMQGDSFRRCSLLNTSADMRKLFQAVNNLLDRQQ